MDGVFLFISEHLKQGLPVNDQQKQWVKEFSLDVLPDLTKEELARLAAAQAAAGL